MVLIIMEGTNHKSQDELILKLDQDRAWLLRNIDMGKWPQIRRELASLERKISKLIISIQENKVEN